MNRKLLAIGAIGVVATAAAWWSFGGDNAESVAPRTVPVDRRDDIERLRDLMLRLPADRVPGRPGHLATRAFIAETLNAFGLSVVEQPVVWPVSPEISLANLEVRLGSTSPDAPVVVICAHYDAVRASPGADDNGAAVAVLLLLAERLAGRTAAAEIRLIWFDAEEVGLVGAGSYVLGLSPVERQRMKGVINLECIGFTDRREGSQALPRGVRTVFDPGTVGDFLLVASNLASGGVHRVVVDALEREERPGVFRVEHFGWIPGEGWVLPDLRRSDHAPFWDAGIPAVLLTDTANFRNQNYHRPGDTVETLDLPFVAAVLRGVEASVVVLADVEAEIGG